MNAVAQAALPVAVALAILAAAARALESEVVAREHLEPLCTWCLIAVGVLLGALFVSGDAGVIPLAVGVGLGVIALALRPSSAVEEPVAPPDAPPGEPAPVERTAGALWARPRS